MLFMVLPVVAYAAGFDCAKATSDAEKSVCADTGLSRLDSDLAAAWKRALSTGTDVDAMKTSQRDWLKQRDICGRDTQCLTDRYRERLAALAQNASHVDDRWQQSWSMDIVSATSGSELIFTGTPPHLHFTITANAGSNEGGLDGDVVVEGDHASFRQEQCRLDFVREGARIRVKQQGYDADCGGGLGVYYGGDYIPTASFKARPQPDLLSVGVLDDARQNAAAQTLLGKDYDALVGTINLGVSEDDQDELGAKVDQYFVRGLANTNAAIVMRKGELLWIGLLVFDTHDQVRLRYYTNVPAWKMQLPKTIQAWRERFDPRPPTDLMP